jgi:hypothetical protein
MSVLGVETELGLYRSTVNTETVEALAGTASEFHILLTAMRVDREGNLDVHACNELCVGELPDVDVVACNNTGESLDILSNLRDTNVLRSGLKKNSSSAPGKRNTSLEDNGSNEQGDGGISVFLARPVGKPDDKGGNHDTNVSKHIADDVEDHSVHAHISVIVTVTVLFGSILGEGVVVTVVDARVSSGSSRMGVGVRVRTVLAVTKGRAVLSDTLEKRGLFIGLVLFHNQRVLGIGLALANLIGIASGSFDNALSETSWVNAQVVETSETRMSTPTGTMIVAAS